MTTPQFTTFQIDTQQAVSPTEGQQSSCESLQLGQDKVRIDQENRPGFHFRAQQLSDFTNWLNNDESSGRAGSTKPQSTSPHATPTPQPNSPPKPKTSTQASASAKKTYRVDAPSSISKPNFPTTDYVADPAEIRRIIQKLKSDGRIIADRQQVVDNDPKTSIHEVAARATSTIEFTWPTITSNLVGSPAILNLETNIECRFNQESGQHFKQLLIASTQSGTGGSTIAMSLARQFSDHGKRILLVDANISNAAITSRLGAGATKSWILALSQRLSMSEVMWQDSHSSVALLPITPLKTSVSWKRKIYDELAKIIDSVAWDFDLIIFDVGNYDQFLGECATPKNMADLTLLVNGKNIAGVADQRRAENRLVDAGITNMLVIQNFSKINNIVNSKVG